MNARSRFLCGLILLWSLVIVTGWAQSVTAKNSYKVARAHASQGRWEEALTELERALGDDPNYLDAIFLRGLCSLALDHDEQAENDLQSVIQRNPDFVYAYKLLAALYVSQDRFEESKTVLLSLVDVPGGKADAYFSLGVVAYEEGDLEEAEAQWKKALGVQVTMGSAYYNLGLLCRLQDRRDLALSHLTQAVEMAPTDPMYRTMLAWELFDHGLVEEAKVELRTVPDFAEENPGVMLFSRALLAFVDKDYQRTEVLTTSALEQNIMLLQAKILQAMAIDKQERYAEARDLYLHIYQDDSNLVWLKKRADAIEQELPVQNLEVKENSVEEPTPLEPEGAVTK